jgi:outer membrane lipoprotein-sorting protein
MNTARWMLPSLLLGGGWPLASAIGQTPAPVQPPAPAPVTTTPSPNDQTTAAKQLLDRLAAKHREVRSLSAAFEQRVRTPLMRKPIVSAGTMVFRREPACAVFTITKPRHSIARFDETSYVIFRPDRQEAERYVFADGDVAGLMVQVFSPKPTEEMEKAFRIGPLESVPVTAGAAPRQRITLLPLKDEMLTYFKSLSLTIEPEASVLRGLSYVNRDGDTVEIEITDLRIDPELEEVVFSAELPEGTNVQVHRLEKQAARPDR